jgi:LacI family transcriptional regulator
MARFSALSQMLSNGAPACRRNNVKGRQCRNKYVIASPAPSVHDLRIHQRVPIVLIDRAPVGFNGPAVLTDNFGAAYEGTQHLIKLGHRHIAIIAGQLGLSNGLDRLEGFRKALQEEHLALPDEYVQKGNFQLEGGYRCGLELMRLPSPPTAIFSCNNKMTLGLMRSLVEMRVNCPEAVSVLGFDDFEWSAYFNPRLTTIAQPTYEMGKQAMQVLLRTLQASDSEHQVSAQTVVRLKAELRIRDSTASRSPELLNA